ncbi:hypothetical protein MBLNU13_g00568t1 [Cladosporium sp. NU13]
MTVKIIELDALVVGAGFGGIYQLKRLRDEGFNVKLVERGTDFGGVWYWNRYPGARVDSPVPHYEFSDPGLHSEWAWSQRFPGSSEIRKYFRYVADKWDLDRDTIFQTTVNSAIWDDAESRWMIHTNGDVAYRCQFFLPNTGIAAKRHTPDWTGIDDFEGTWIHPSYWPKEEICVRGKKIAVVGTGSTGIQLTQELAPLASEFVLFQRTPNLALPMKQVAFAGQGTEIVPRSDKRTFEDSTEDRHKMYEDLWSHGDFHFWLATYCDMLFDDNANTEAYNFWRDKVRARLPNERLREKFAPNTKPHAFGCKRISLENEFYELFVQPNVHLVDMKETPIDEITPKGIRTTEKEWEFDLIGRGGLHLQDKWQSGVKTFVGMSVNQFPNMFFTYGPQAPTALCNGPSCAELQGEWIVSLLKYMRENNVHTVNATAASEKTWTENIQTIANQSLLPKANSWYMGDNIPGKTREPLIYLGGVPTYYKFINDCAASGYGGFDLE